MQQQRKSSLVAYLILSVLLISLFTKAASATEHDELALVSKSNHELINNVGAGTLFMRGEKTSHYQIATLLGTRANVSISGPVASTQLTQTFINTGVNFTESLYVFPLPENAAIEYMEIIVGNRRIIGQIMEKQQAKQVYTQAKRAGKRTALVEQSRPNLFKTSVANIPAGEQVSVTLHFNQSLPVSTDASNNALNFEYRLPLTLTPRYHPRPMNESHLYNTSVTDELANDTLQKNLLEEVQYSSRQKTPAHGVLMPQGNTGLFPPQVSADSQSGITNPLNIQVKVHGLRFNTHIKSQYQKIEQMVIDDVRHINFKHKDMKMDQDFVLTWSMNDSPSNQAQFFTESVNGKEYGLLMLSAPQIEQRSKILPREVIFIIDSSGSMGGESMRQAKESLLFALDNLATHERFNIIDFDSGFTELFAQPKIANDKHIQQANRFVQRLSAGGGTNMAPALASALNMTSDKRFLKQVIFITDGAVSNEQQLFTLLHDKLGQTRLFTVGIGSAPNSYFMRKASEFGRGSFTYIGSIDEVTPKMSELFKKIGSPILQDIELIFPDGTKTEKWPKYIPDLYTGEPVIIPIQFDQRPAWVTLKGHTDHAWERTLMIDKQQQNPGISSLWARKKIEYLMDRMVRGESEDTIKPQVLEVALAHHLMSRYTSFVAVDETVVRNKNSKLESNKIPNLLPKGSNYPATANGLRLWYLLALSALLLSLLLQYSIKTSNMREI